MDAVAARSMKRPRWRAYLLLSRISNLPTVWSNVLAGIVAAHAAVQWPDVVRLAAGVSLLYTAGMFLNDAFDRDIDAVERPDRPIPAGDVSARPVFVSGFAMLAAGEAVIATQPRFAAPLAWGVALAAAIVLYDFRHKKKRFGPVVMGVCRGLVYCVAAAATAMTVVAVVVMSPPPLFPPSLVCPPGGNGGAPARGPGFFFCYYGVFFFFFFLRGGGGGVGCGALGRRDFREF